MPLCVLGHFVSLSKPHYYNATSIYLTRSRLAVETSPCICLPPLNIYLRYLQLTHAQNLRFREAMGTNRVDLRALCAEFTHRWALRMLSVLLLATLADGDLAYGNQKKRNALDSRKTEYCVEKVWPFWARGTKPVRLGNTYLEQLSSYSIQTNNTRYRSASKNPTCYSLLHPSPSSH